MVNQEATHSVCVEKSGNQETSGPIALVCHVSCEIRGLLLLPAETSPSPKIGHLWREVVSSAHQLLSNETLV